MTAHLLWCQGFGLQDNWPFFSHLSNTSEFHQHSSLLPSVVFLSAPMCVHPTRMSLLRIWTVPVLPSCLNCCCLCFCSCVCGSFPYVLVTYLNCSCLPIPSELLFVMVLADVYYLLDLFHLFVVVVCLWPFCLFVCLCCPMTVGLQKAEKASDVGGKY